MLYVLYSSVGNSEGIEEYIAYSEIDDDGYCSRHLEIHSDGTALRYTEDLAADTYGQLPEGLWDAAEASRQEYGTVASITESLFNAVWRLTKCKNADCR
jgi:hypothetical protein